MYFLSRNSSSDYAHRNNLYWALNLFHFINDAIVFLIPTIMATLYEEFDLTFSQTSAVLAFNVGATVVFQVFNGYWVDKGKEKFLYLFGLPFMTTSVFLLLLAKNFTTLLLLATLNGIGLSFVHALVYSIGIKLFPKEKEDKQSKMAAFGDFGKLLAISSSAIMLAANRSKWRLPLFFWGTVAFFIFIFALFIVPQFPFEKLKNPHQNWNETNKKNSNNGENEIKTERIQVSKEIFQEKKSQKPQFDPKTRKRTMFVLYVVFFLYSASNELMIKPFTLYMRVNRAGLSSQFPEFLYIIFMITGTLGVVSSGRIKAKIGFRKFMAILYAGQIPTTIIFLVLDLDNLYADIVFSALLGFFYLTVYITIQSELAFYVKFKKLGFGYASLLSFGWFGGFVFQLVGGFTADKYGVQWYFILSVILAIIVIVLVQFVSDRPPTSNSTQPNKEK